MNESENKTTLLPATQLKACRDELNFAEFPLAALGPVPDGTKTLVFEDPLYDPSRGKVIDRRVTISASDSYGLPTSRDDEVILGLIQLSSQQGFADHRVHFTRHELVKLLGWPDNGKSYARINQSLQRWLGVTLYYENAWWSREESAWVTEGFHVINSLTLLDKERRERQRKTDQPHAGQSSFVWNELVFRSFTSGYLKKLDLEFYHTLRTPVTKRLYRFLDKRFYHRSRWEFDLRKLACEHIGLSKAYHNSKIKERMRPAIAELEEKGFLAPLDQHTRFKRVQHGVWNVVFVQSAERGGDKDVFVEPKKPKPLPPSSSPGPTDQELADVESVKVIWEQLTQTERQELERDAVHQAPAFLKNQYDRTKTDGGVLFREVRRKIIHDHVLKVKTEPV